MTESAMSVAGLLGACIEESWHTQRLPASAISVAEATGSIPFSKNLPRDWFYTI